MSQNVLRGMMVLVLAVCVLSAGVVWSAPKDVPRISKEELKGELGAPNVIVLDVRAGKDWSSSDVKIQGAVREDPKDIDAWASKYAKDKKIVLYCA